jgi:hypothetical protein
MKALRNTLALMLVALLYQQTCLARVDPGDWVVVQGLKGGERVQVDLFKGGKLTGILHHVTPEAVFVQTAMEIREAERGNVRRLYTRGKSSKGRAALIGAGAGAAVAGIAGPRTMEHESGYGGAVAGTVVAGAVIGALVGLAVGSHGKRILLYKAPSKPR